MLLREAGSLGVLLLGTGKLAAVLIAGAFIASPARAEPLTFDGAIARAQPMTPQGARR
jgi:hypothetical protein